MKIFIGSNAKKLNEYTSQRKEEMENLAILERTLELQVNQVIDIYGLYNEDIPFTIENIKNVFISFSDINMYQRLCDFINTYYSLSSSNNIITGQDFLDRYQEEYGSSLEDTLISYGWTKSEINDTNKTKLSNFFTNILSNVNEIKETNLSYYTESFVIALYYDIKIKDRNINEEMLNELLNERQEYFITLVKLYCTLFNFVKNYNDLFLEVYSEEYNKIGDIESCIDELKATINNIDANINEIYGGEIVYSNQNIGSNELISKTHTLLDIINNELQSIIDNNNLDIHLNIINNRNINIDDLDDEILNNLIETNSLNSNNRNLTGNIYFN